MAVFEKHICSDDVRDRLCLNAARLTTYDKMKDEVAGVLLARQGRSAAAAGRRDQLRWTLAGLDGRAKAKATKAKATRTSRTEKGRTSLPTRARVRRARRPRRSVTGVDARGILQADCHFKEEYEQGKGGVNLVEDSKEKGETLAVDWVLAVVGERGETIVIDSGAVCSTCPPGFVPLAALENAAGERPLRAVNGLDLENFGTKVVKQEVKLASGKPTQVLTKYRAANVQRPIISQSEAVNGGSVGFFSKDFSGIARVGDIEIVVKSQEKG